ncbi:MAG TPA: exo-beta-N-acetylmuramidase NamZ domain-containing protein, partial [Acidobacteriota bacterium]|nr:exo-beta-N-acetylmuramidase NamZ domain-containing protein [Acidobacteriota bacterium]
MKGKLIVLGLAAGILLAGCGGGGGRPAAPATAGVSTVKPGLDVLLEKRLDLLAGKRVGLITNQTGVDRLLRSAIDRFKAAAEVRLVALYGPEHGVRGNAQAGEYVPFYYDDKYGLPVFSL